MTKVLLAGLLAISFVYGADTSAAPGIGTWKLDVAKSDFSKNPNSGPREATLVIKEDGWTWTATDTSGKKSDLTSQGSDKIGVKNEPTGNAYLVDVRFIEKESGKEIQRSVAATMPDGKTMAIFSSGVTPDGKTWSDVTCWKKVH